MMDDRGAIMVPLPREGSPNGLPPNGNVMVGPPILATTPGPPIQTNTDYPPPSLTPRDIAAIAEAGCKGGTFQCTLCHKTFGYKNGLIRHVRLTHAGEKPYQCNICNRRFGYKHILMEHQNLHFGNRPYACNMCDKKFAARSNLIQHRMVHKRPFNCSMCNKRFDREDQLKKHMFAHPQALLTCNFCNYAAASQADLNTHMVEQHNPQIMDTRPTPRRSSTDNSAGGGSDYGGPIDDESNSNPQMTNESPPDLEQRAMTPPDHLHQQPMDPNIPLGMQPTIGGMPLMYSRLNMDHRAQRVENICSQLSMTGAPSLSPISPTLTPNTPTPASSPYIPVSTSAVMATPSDPRPDQQYASVVVKKEADDPVYLERNPSRGSIESPPNDYPSPGVPNNLLMGAPTTPFHTNRPPIYTNGHLENTVGPQPPTPEHFNGGHIQMPSPVSTPTTLPTSSALPAIHEVFSRRAPRGIPPFNNFSGGVPPMLCDRQNSNDIPMPMLSPPPPTNPSLSPATPPPETTSPGANGINLPSNNGTGTNPPGSGIVMPMSQTNHARPMAQLPPIAQVLRNTKDAVVQHTAAIPGFPALDDVLSYYMSQGRLFKCQHCHILFFERGMYFLHASLHGASSPWECSICHKVCLDKNEFTLHFVNQQHNSYL